LNGSFTVDNGVLNLVNATNGTVDLNRGTLQAAGTLWNFHPGSLAAEDLILDIGGPAAATLTTEIFFPDLSLARLRIEFGIGNDASDLWKMNSGLFFLSDPGDLQFAFHNLGGVTTDVDYQLISYVDSFPPSPDLFTFAPDAAAAGWAGTFQSKNTGVYVRFTSVPVPEPGTAALLLLQGAALSLAARRWLRRS
jgi:hypothetical protein